MFALIFRDALAELFGNKAGEFIADYKIAMEGALVSARVEE